MNSNKKESEDIVLIKSADKGDENAFETLYHKYHAIGEKYARIFFAQRNYNRYIADEYVGEIDLVFLNAFRKFDRKLQSFHAYFTAILDHSLLKYVSRVLRSNDVLRTSLSLDYGKDKFSFYDLIEDSTIVSYKDLSTINDAKLKISSLESSFNKRKSNAIKAIIILKLQGYTISEISNLLDLSTSSVCRFYQDFVTDLNKK